MSEEFCAGVQIVLKRMESNPEEFKLGSKKWDWITEAHWATVVSHEEHIAITKSLNAIRRREFTDQVMSTLLNDTSPQAEFNWAVNQ